MIFRSIHASFLARLSVYLLSAGILCFHAMAEVNEDTPKKLSVKTAIDAGHVVKGMQGNQDVEMLPLNRNTVTLEWGKDFSDFWALKMGIVNILWWPFGGEVNQPFERIVRVEPALSVAKLQANFKKAQSWSGFVEIGYFPYKYNQDARNLGEYLHRSGTYPGYLMTTENWQLMNGARTYKTGVHGRLSHLGDRLSHDVTLFLETEIDPIGDITPGYEINLNLGFLEVGAGCALNHYLSFHPSQLEPKDENHMNTYVELDYTVTTPQGDSAVRYAGPMSSLPANIQTDIEDSLITPRVTSHWSHRGIKLMGKAALNPGLYLPEGLLGPEDLRIFMEVAVLGLEDKEYFYETLSERVPVMFGVNLPTFRLIDLLCVQIERYDSPYNNFLPYNELSLPTWQDGEEPKTRDDWKWSVYAMKTINRLFKLHVQVANDHLRTLKYDRIKSNVPLTRNPTHWYYLAKLEFGF
jgi:hypothetical protein